MRILYIVNSENACTYYRAQLPTKYINKHSEHSANAVVVKRGINNTTLSDEEREKLTEIIADHDVVIISRTANWSEVIEIAEYFDVPLIYETDDYPIPDKKHYLNKYSRLQNFKQNMMYSVRHAVGMICSTHQLRETFQRYTDNIQVVPNMIDYTEAQWNAKKRPESSLVVGYFGGPSHYYDLREIRPAIVRILNEFPSVQFRYGAIPQKMYTLLAEKGTNSLKRIEGKFENKLEQKYLRFLEGYDDRVQLYTYRPLSEYGTVYTEFDIGIAPLESNFFNMHKSNLKLLEYAAYDIPVVATDLRPFAETLKHGETGYLAVNADEFYRYLRRLICDAEKRSAMGRYFGSIVRDDYNMNTHWDRHITAIETLLFWGHRG